MTYRDLHSDIRRGMGWEDIMVRHNLPERTARILAGVP
jgi:hypothetical protein